MASSKVRVLVVDDQVQFRTAAGYVIARTEGFELVGEARSGEESLDLIDQKHPDLVLMDIRMGAMSGIDASRLAVAEHPGLTVFLCSTYGQADMPADALDAAAAYIPKEELSAQVLRDLWDDAQVP